MLTSTHFAIMLNNKCLQLAVYIFKVLTFLSYLFNLNASNLVKLVLKLFFVQINISIMCYSVSVENYLVITNVMQYK